MSLNDLKIQAFTEPVSDLPDNPSQSGITAEELKRRFDANANNELKPSVNGIIDFLLSFTDGEEIKGIRVNEDNVVEVTKDGANYIDTGYSKEYITDMLSEKVDKSDVLLKTNTEEFTPTDIYQPATKKYVDDKILSAGAADMTQAVYDPTGRQTDIFAEMEKYLPLTGGTLTDALTLQRTQPIIYMKDDQSGRQALLYMYNGQFYIRNTSSGGADRIALLLNPETEDISRFIRLSSNVSGESTMYNLFGEHNKDLIAQSFLPLTGGTMTGNLNITKGAPEIVMTHSSTNRYLNIFVGSDNNVYFRNAADGNNRTAFYLQAETVEDFGKALRLQKMIDGTASYYNIFGEHNKPSGSYTGGGSSKTVSVGGVGNMLLLYGNEMLAIVTPMGAICKMYESDAIYGLKSSYLGFSGGKLTISGTANTNFNASGATYNYQVL